MWNILNGGTPRYRGDAQTASGGILGFLGNLLGGGTTPTYKGAGQPAPSGSGLCLLPVGPAYKPAPKSDPEPTPEAPAEPEPEADEEQPIIEGPLPDEEELCGRGPVTIVIRRRD